MEGGKRNAATGMDELWLCRGSWAFGVYQLDWVDLDSGITNPTSFRTSSARELQPEPKQDLSQQKLYTPGPTGTNARGAHIAPQVGAHVFCSLH